MRRLSKWTMVAFSVASVLAISQNAFAFADDDARKAILDLREKVSAGQNAQMQLAGQLDQLREQNAALTGQVERLNNEVAQQQRSIRDLFTNIDKRVAAFESHLEKGEGNATFTVTPEEKRRYDLALTLFSEGQFDQSCDLLKSLIVDYPKSGYKPNALYWIGCGLFAQNRLEESIATQKRLIKDFPSSSRVPEAMLSKAAAEASIGRKNDARVTLQTVVRKFKGTEMAKVAKERLRALGPVAAATATKNSAPANSVSSKTATKSDTKTTARKNVVELQ